MKIAYDASLISGQSGIERYTQELLRAMLRRAGDDDVQVVGDRGQGPLLDTLLGRHANLSIVDAMVSEHRVRKPLRPLVRIFRQHQLSGAVRSADVVHLLGPQKIVPRARKLAVTIHDLFPLDPSMELHSVLVRRFPAIITRQLKAADMVMTPSTYVAGTIREHFPWYAGPIRVTPLAADAVFAPTPLSEATRTTYGITKPYVIFVGRVDGRKNLRRILAAWRSLPQALRSEAREGGSAGGAGGRTRGRKEGGKKGRTEDHLLCAVRCLARCRRRPLRAAPPAMPRHHHLAASLPLSPVRDSALLVRPASFDPPLPSFPPLPPSLSVCLAPSDSREHVLAARASHGASI